MMLTLVLAGLLLTQASQPNQNMADCPMHAQHLKNQAAASQQASEDHFDSMNRRGDEAMGFDHMKTSHHFLVQTHGGVIRVEANDPNDEASRSAIRSHLAHIAKAFSAGDFDIPMFIHDQMPPGVAVMKSRKDKIKYRYHELKDGAEVVISSADSTAVQAIHDFLQFQIEEHRTGDSSGH